MSGVARLCECACAVLPWGIARARVVLPRPGARVGLDLRSYRRLGAVYSARRVRTSSESYGACCVNSLARRWTLDHENPARRTTLAFLSDTMSDVSVVVVTGASGFIGAHIVKACLERGYDVNACVCVSTHSGSAYLATRLQHI